MRTRRNSTVYMPGEFRVSMYYYYYKSKANTAGINPFTVKEPVGRSVRLVTTTYYPYTHGEAIQVHGLGRALPTRIRDSDPRLGSRKGALPAIQTPSRDFEWRSESGRPGKRVPPSQAAEMTVAPDLWPAAEPASTRPGRCR
jgi:hypothetical protein